MQDKDLHTDKYFTDRAWGEMRKLLDQELPVLDEKKRRPFIFWMTGAVAIAALLSGVYFFTNFTIPDSDTNSENELIAVQNEMDNEEVKLNANANTKSQITTSQKKENALDTPPIVTNNKSAAKHPDNQQITESLPKNPNKQQPYINHLTENKSSSNTGILNLPVTNSTGISETQPIDLTDKENQNGIDKNIVFENINSKSNLVNKLETLPVSILKYNHKIDPLFLSEKKQKDIRNTVFVSTLFAPGSKTNGLNAGYIRRIKTNKSWLTIEAGAAYDYIAQPIEFTYAETTTPGGQTSQPEVVEVLYDVSYAVSTNSRILNIAGDFSNYNPNSANSVSFNRLKLHYLSLPLKASFSKGKFVLSSGIQGGILLFASNNSFDGGFLTIFDSNKNEDLFNGLSEIAKADSSVPIPSISNIDFSATLGLGYNLSENVGLHINYIYGLKDVIKHNSNKDYNRLLQLSMQYSW